MNVDLRTCFFALLISCFCFSGFAQKTEKPGFIGYSVGPSFHIGNLDFLSSYNEQKQFAKTGYCVNYLNFGYSFKNRTNLGMTASVFYGETFVINTNENDWWVIMGISAGPMLSFHVEDKLHFDLKLRSGLGGTINYIDGSAGTNDFGVGFAIDFRTAVRYDILKHWCILLEAGYTNIHQKFPDSRKVNIQEIITGVGLAYKIQ